MRAAIECFLLGAILVALFWVFKSNLEVQSEIHFQRGQMNDYARELNAVNGSLSKAVQDYTDRNARFEATGYTANVLEDGRVEVTFLRNLGPKDPEHPKKGNDWAEVRTVILPAWMWAQVTAEAALKLGFEALEKKGAK